MRRGLLVALIVIGLGLVAAPAIFQMFTRAPLGAQMIHEFRPYMNDATIEGFQSHLGTIDSSEVETRTRMRALFAQRLGYSEADFTREFPLIAALNREWPGISADMGGMLETMSEDIDNYAAVDALPDFDRFPWFFVAPGLLVAGISMSGLAAARRGRSSSAYLWVLGAIGLGLIAAPAVFQMFTRAPLGGQMINDFRPLMRSSKVTAVQGYFITIAGAEGELRNKLKPLASSRAGLDEARFAAEFPSTTAFLHAWPTISHDMAPMVGAMSDNVDNFAAVDALPPFPLFPWFFVLPGVMIIALAFFARSRAAPGASKVVAPSPSKEG